MQLDFRSGIKFFLVGVILLLILALSGLSVGWFDNKTLAPGDKTFFSTNQGYVVIVLGIVFSIMTVFGLYLMYKGRGRGSVNKLSSSSSARGGSITKNGRSNKKGVLSKLGNKVLGDEVLQTFKT